MKVKLVRHTGNRPPGIGIWWQIEDDSDISLAEMYFNQLKEMDEEHVRSMALEGKRAFHYAYDLLVNWPRDYAKDVKLWLEQFWGVGNTYDSNYIGIQLDLEPEVNEFGVVSP